MKRCPQCNRVETDEALKFCRADGATLVSDSGPTSGEAGTAKFISATVSSEIETSVLPHRTDAEINRPTASTTGLPATPTAATTRKLSKSRRLGFVFVTMGLAVIVIAVAAYFYFSRNRKTTIDSIAVLPFENRSNDADADYLSDGIAESIINSLTRLPNLKVIPASTVLRYRGKTSDPQKAGDELHVNAVLSGRMIQRGDNVTISVELDDVRYGKQLWGEQYNRKLSDLLAVQNEIANEISQRLRTELSGEERQKLTKGSTTNPDAYQLYLKGRYHLSKVTVDSLAKAVDCFNQAIDRDPSYAQAYAGLADTYNWLALVKYPPREAIPRMKAAAQKALQIDESLADAHTSLAITLYEFDYDWPAAEREFKRAIELNPDYAPAHYEYGWFLASRRRYQESIDKFNQAMQLEPLNVKIIVDNSVPYTLLKQFDRGLEFTRKGEELEPNSYYCYVTEGWIYTRKGDYQTAIAKSQKALQLENTPWTQGWLGCAYALAGDRPNAQKILDKLSEDSKQRYVSPYFSAEIYAALKDKEKTIEYLQKAYADKATWLTFLGVDDVFDFVRSDPRFQEIARGVGVPQ
jgi:TolB-like protein/Tfp pilus assembly protein PilF